MQPHTVRLDVRQAIEGFLLAKQAEGCSPNTITDYRNCLGRHFVDWLALAGKSHLGLAEITPTDLRGFLAHLRTVDNGRGAFLSPKTVKNVHVALQSLYAWAHAEWDLPDCMERVPAPKAPTSLIQPLGQDQIAALLKACDVSRETRTRNRKAFVARRSTALRDRAIVVLLLDTGLRAGELCRLTFADVDLSAGQVAVKQAKCSSVRHVYIGKVAKRALWRYLTQRGQGAATDPVFATMNGRALSVDRLTKLLANLGERAGFHVHPHQLRHTFATELLRGGANVLAAQRLLGHRTLAMVERYAKIAEADLAEAHRRASPADRLL